MSEKEMPAIEANSYEFAFHVLPTVAEGEVSNVFQKLKDIITKAGGEITNEEAPAHYDLAYEIVKYLEGRNRKFSSAYFGWVRFTTTPSTIDDISDSISGVKELLRHLLIKLTKIEEANPFFFHETLAERKIETVEITEDDISDTNLEKISEQNDSIKDSEDENNGGEESKDNV